MQNNFLIDHITNISLNPQQLNESVDLAKQSGTGLMLIPNIHLQEKDGLNQNKRVYPAEILEREVAKYVKNCIGPKCSFGELDHPESATIRLKEVSHLIPRVNWEGNKLNGDLLILDTPNGKIAESILRAGGRLGVSSRSLGSTKRQQNEATGDSYDEVCEDLELICWDIVSNPSVLAATFKLHEGLDVNRRVLEKYNKINHYINKILGA